MSAQEALGRLASDERAAVETFRNRLHETLGARLRDLRIYGSKVRGDANEESDVDLLVLIDGDDWPTRSQIIELACSISHWLSPTIYDFDRYHAPVSRATGFYKEMRNEFGQAVTPGEGEHARNELTRAQNALRDARNDLDTDAPESAANRQYYAVFHAARAALIVRGVHSKSHAGQITLFETFGSHPILSKLLNQQIQADYAREPFATSVETLRGLTGEVEAFIGRCRVIVEEALARGPDEPDPSPDL